MDLKFDELFKISIACLRLNRSYPGIIKNKKWFLEFGIIHFVLFLIFYVAVYSITRDVKDNNVSRACANSTLALIFFVLSFKYCILLYYQNLLKGLMDTMKRDYEIAKELDAAEQEFVIKYAEKGRWICKLWLVLSICSGSLFPVKALLLTAYNYIAGDFTLVPIYDLTYPTFIDERKNCLHVYIAIFFLFLIVDLYAATMYTGLVPLGPIFMLHACGQLEILKTRIRKLFPGKQYNPELNRSEFKRVIQLLQHVYRFVDNVKTSFCLLYEMTFKVTAVFLPITFYQVLESFRDGQLSLEFITFIFGGILLCSVPCYYSNMLIEISESIRMELYVSNWELHWDRRSRSTLLLLLIRTAQPVAIRTMFDTISLLALSDLFHHCYAIFNVLNAAWH